MTEAPILIAPDWTCLELMCDASDFANWMASPRERKNTGIPTNSYAAKHELKLKAHTLRSEKELLARFYAYEVEVKIVTVPKTRKISQRDEMLQNSIRFWCSRVPSSGDRVNKFLNTSVQKVIALILSHSSSLHRVSPPEMWEVEVSNRGLKIILERTVGEDRAFWSDKLDDALWAFRTTYKTPIGCTPYKLVYGKACPSN
ncbi:reverse transcriptase domain-containing protein [Tanacetum coccineum]